jgi:HEAT repeat protein
MREEDVGMFGAVILGILVSLPRGLLYLYALRNAQTMLMKMWRAVAEECGITDLRESGGPWGKDRLEGRTGELYVRFWPERSDKQIGVTRVSIDGADRLVPLSLRRERRGVLWRDRALREIQIGDKAFDDDFHVTGPHTFVRAILDADTRRLLSALLTEADLEVRGGRLEGRIPSWPAISLLGGDQARTMSLLLDAARRLERPPDIVSRLARNARHDPVAAVRVANLLTLVGEYPDHPATEPSLVAACSDENDAVRVRAAIALGERGRATLLEVALGALDDAAGAQAVAALGEHLEFGHAKDALGRALRLRKMETARACLTALGGDGNADAIGVLSRVLGIEEGGLAVAAADALGATGSPAAEPPLIAALARDIPEVRVAAARALGRVGSAGAVLPLKEAEARHAGIEAFRRAARQAIAEIQSRLGGASPGQLSLAAAEAGTLSLVDDKRGRLSLKPPEER